MTRVRLRPVHDPAALGQMYREPHDHTRWADHVQRVAATVEAGRALVDAAGVVPATIADLSCGDAAIARTLSPPFGNLILGDYAPGYPITGPVEQTIRAVTSCDLFVCCETIEHLDDPDTVLAIIRERTVLLLLSTPVDDIGQAGNPEHYWSFGVEDVRAMLEATGFDPVLHRVIHCDTEGTAYQIWGCQ